jgi:triosephosphate isomerase
MRRKIVAGNWKMNTDLTEGVALAKAIDTQIADLPEDSLKRVILAPPFSHLYPIQQVIDPTRICLAAQNCAEEERGAFTGEISARMLRSVGAQAVIIGHSERRMLFHETDQILKRKIQRALENDLQIIFCCGEILDERKNIVHLPKVRQQLTDAPFTLTKADFQKIIIAYEPVWAIGTGLTATTDQAQDMHEFIRSLIEDRYGIEVAEATTILYGGSCKASNACDLFAKPDVDGGLIGGAALLVDDFMAIVRAL